MILETLKSDFDWYLANQDTLVETYNGKFLAIHNKKVVADKDSYDEAYISAKELGHAPGSFLIQKCSPGDIDYTVTISTPDFL
jgi:hypothetical protein